MNGVKSFDFEDLFGENVEKGECSLEYVIEKIIADDPTLAHLVETQKNICEENQVEYEKTNEYKAAKLLAENHFDDFFGSKYEVI